jgi:formylmethanofuran dehydrogenase subunit B
MKGFKNIFLLEDSLERINWFKETFSECPIVHTKDVQEAIDILKKTDFDIVFLDRDLSYSNPTENGEYVTRKMKELKLALNSIIVIHTVNPFGQISMMQDIRSYHDNVYLLPFPVLMKMHRESFPF